MERGASPSSSSAFFNRSFLLRTVTTIVGATLFLVLLSGLATEVAALIAALVLALLATREWQKLSGEIAATWIPLPFIAFGLTYLVQRGINLPVLFALSLAPIMALAALTRSRGGMLKGPIGVIWIWPAFFLLGAASYWLPDYLRLLALWAILPVWLGDTAAYLGGRWLGKRPLAPKLSPNKTWEGAICYLLGAASGLVIIGSWFPLSLAAMLVGTLVVTVLGQLGDLGQSALKRASNLKDSGSLLPGHGGILDRFDGFLVAYLPLLAALLALS